MTRRKPSFRILSISIPIAAFLAAIAGCSTSTIHVTHVSDEAYMTRSAPARARRPAPPPAPASAPAATSLAPIPDDFALGSLKFWSALSFLLLAFFAYGRWQTCLNRISSWIVWTLSAAVTSGVIVQLIRSPEKSEWVAGGILIALALLAGRRPSTREGLEASTLLEGSVRPGLTVHPETKSFANANTTRK